MRKAALYNLGCKVNAYETDAMGELLLNAGYEIVDFEEDADVYIVNTCSVTNMADRKSRQVLHRARKNNPDAVIVACGCYVETAQLRNPNEKPDPSIDIVIGNDGKRDIVAILEAWYNGETLEERMQIDRVKVYEDMEISTTMEHTRAFLKIQDGCNQFCSYCIIPFARGRVRSRSIENVVKEVESLAANGYKEVVLTGIHISSFGTDTGESLLDLIRAVHQVEGIRRIRLGSLEPRIITEEFTKALGEMPKFCPHFHLSLQSGCDRTLKAMNRKYTAEEFAGCCDLIRKVWPEAALTTDVIVGFPQESEEDFAASYAFVEKIRFFETHIFKYSRRKGTKADQMAGQLTDAVKTERSAKLLTLNEMRKKEYMERFLDRELEILTEEEQTVDGSICMVGHTAEYVPCAILPKADGSLPKSGEFVRARGKRVLGNDMLICIIE